MPRTKEQAREYYLKNKNKWTDYRKKSQAKPEVKAKRLGYTAEWRKRNPDKLKAVEKQRLTDGRMYESAKKWADKNPEKVKQYRKNQYWRDRDKRLAEHRDYYQKNKETIKAKTKAYRQTPAGKATQKRSTTKIRSTKHGQLRHNISSAVRLKLLNHGGKKYRASINKILPFKIEELEARLESMFQAGMTWDNYGDWHVDHIVPDSSFDYASVKDPEFVQSWALDNLQPLWASENCSKGSKNITEA